MTAVVEETLSHFVNEHGQTQRVDTGIGDEEQFTEHGIDSILLNSHTTAPRSDVECTGNKHKIRDNQSVHGRHHQNGQTVDQHRGICKDRVCEYDA